MNAPKGIVKTLSRGASPFARVHEPVGAFNEFLTALDPRGDSARSNLLRFALAKSRDVRFHEFLERLYQPRFPRWSLAAIARSCDLTLGEFMVFWQRAQIDHAIAIMTYAVPDVAAGLVRAALAREETCEKCDGLGWLYVDAWVPPEIVPGYLGGLSGDPEGRGARTCPFCRGAGKIEKPGDVDSAAKVLEIAGLGCKNRPAVQIVQDFSGASHESAMRELSAMTIDVSDRVADEE